MSNLPTLPDADAQEPTPDENLDEDLIGEPMEGDQIGSDLPEPSTDSLPSVVEPGSTVSNDFA